MAALPAGTVAFLFTDVEGSTRRWEAFPTAMAAAIAEHDALLRRVVEEHGGQVFKTVGDAVCAAFPEGGAALAAAVAGQRALAAEAARWEAVGGLAVRMACHVGAAEARDGDYFGPPLNRVARLLAAAHGGQILLSGAAHDLVADALPAGVSLRHLGRHRLKDLEGSERLFGVVVADLPSDFPPPRTPEGRLHDLPTPPTPLIGREAEIAAATAILAGDGDGARLLTLTGPGGAGKTRLSLHLAATLGLDFPDGARFVPLAAITDPELVLPEIVAAVGARDAVGTPREQLRATLRPLRLLLVLDNLEQVTAAGPAIADLLADCPNLAVIVTSREPLRLRGERELPVPPLALPPLPAPRPGSGPAATPTLEPEAALASPAVRLFAERARGVKASFAVTAENAGAVAALCSRLDGLPLAIELAAARVRLLPPTAILARLDQHRPRQPRTGGQGSQGSQPRLDLLAAGSRDLPARHQTMRDTIAWSYDLLDADEQRCFRRLAVFVGGCPLEAADAVLGAESAGPGGAPEAAFGAAPAAFDLVLSLVEKSLLRIEEEGEEEPRVGMLETIREFGGERLAADPGEAAATGAAHAGFFLALAEGAAPRLDGPEQARWLDALERDHANLRAALGWLRDEGDPGAALRLAGALWRFWWLRGYPSEGRTQLEALLPLASGADAALRITALNGAGVLAECQGDYDRAAALHEEGLALARAAGDRRAIAWSLNNLGVVELNRGDLDRARSLLEENLAIARQTDDPSMTGTAKIDLGQVAHSQGDYDRAMALYRGALTLFQQVGDDAHAARALNQIGSLSHQLGDHSQAETLLSESLRLTQAVGDKQAIAHVLNNLAEVARAQRSEERAEALYRASRELAQEIGDRLLAAIVAENLASLAQERGRIAEATDLYREALGTYRVVGDGIGVTTCLVRLGEAALETGDPSLATRLLAASAALSAASDLPEVSVPVSSPVLASAKSTLGAEAFDREWDAGRALTLDQALTEARLITAGS